MTEEEREAYAVIKLHVAAHPAIGAQAFADGIAKAVRDANQQTADKDVAFRCALALVHEKRLTKENKAELNRLVAQQIYAPTASGYERMALEQAK
jgi:hypothetical protein